MAKKLFSVLFAVLMLVGVMAGCTGGMQEGWYSYSEEVEVGAATGDGDTDETADGEEDTVVTDKKGNTVATSKKNTTAGKRTKTTTAKNNQNSAQTGVRTRTTRAKGDTLSFTPVADAGADYDVKGTVSIAVDTNRATDYEAMFDVMMELYPNIDFVFDYHTDGANGSYSSYLSKKIATKTAANIMWDSAEYMTRVLANGWVKPITKYFSVDAESKYVPDNLVEDYTYFGELYALPHSATFEVTYINTDLLNKLSLSLPALDWTAADYESYLRKAGATFDDGLCVGTDFLYAYTHERMAAYYAILDGYNIGEWGYDYATKQFQVKYIQKGASTLRAWRVIPGAEGWYQASQTSGSTNLLQQNLGISSEHNLWKSGKCLLKDSGSWVYPEMEDTLSFNWEMWTYPNQDGKLMYHVDNCYVTSSTPDSSMEAVYQALRFMTFATNGNLARLQMYEKSEAGKYALNAHVYYPCTTNAKVIEKFNNLDCTTKVDEYLVKNIPNSCRFDSFKLVPEIEDAEKLMSSALNQVTDGSDPSVLNDPCVKANNNLKQAWSDFETDYKKYN